jgi:hypothetical protein
MSVLRRKNKDVMAGTQASDPPARFARDVGCPTPPANTCGGQMPSADTDSIAAGTARPRETMVH